MRVALVSTYPPRPCGIGTFSRDLREALLAAPDVRGVDVVAITRDSAPQEPEVVARIRQDVRGDYPAAARILLRRGVDVVIVEHEFGIFGGRDGAYVLDFAQELRWPLVVCLHTVISEPSPHQAETLRSLCRLATLVTVFTETARRLVARSSLATADRVRVVPHGGPVELLPGRHDGHGVKRGLRLDGRDNGDDGTPSQPALDGLEGRTLLSTFGLISEGKGIETAIEALPEIVARHPEVVYLVAGRTHPEVARREGERYRLSLERQARDLGVMEHVYFDDRFLTVDELAATLAATDLYLTPYRSREQIVSGALTFAVVAGCPVVSTPYYYAEDLLGSGAGVLVPFDDPRAMADAVLDLLDHPDRLAAAARAAEAVGGELAWPRVGRSTARVLREAIELGSVRSTAGRPPPAPLPRARLTHLMTLVDDVGIVQHAVGVLPYRQSGYCVDDVARLALVALGLRLVTGEEAHSRMLTLALAFLTHAWNREQRAMHNLLSYDRRWLDTPHHGDHTGRAAWALGQVLAADPPLAVARPTQALLEAMLPALGALPGLRPRAFAVLGLAGPDPAVLGEGGSALLRRMAEGLADRYRAAQEPGWRWFEDDLSYDNARLPQALIAAGRRLEDAELVRLGIEALDWYGEQVDLDGPHVRLIGHHGLKRGAAPPGDGDQQPLDAAALVEAEVEALEATGDAERGLRAVRAFDWFLGRNGLGVPVYDFATGGCFDGLGPHDVNMNEGAESMLAFLHALLQLDAAGLQTSFPD